MELREFVSATLVEIVRGVRDAQRAVKAEKIPSAINPGSRGREGMLYARKEVEFDVAITATEGSESKSGIGVVVASVGIGAQRKSGASSESVSRIKFAVPVILPTEG